MNSIVIKSAAFQIPYAANGAANASSGTVDGAAAGAFGSITVGTVIVGIVPPWAVTRAASAGSTKAIISLTGPAYCDG